MKTKQSYFRLFFIILLLLLTSCGSEATPIPPNVSPLAILSKSTALPEPTFLPTPTSVPAPTVLPPHVVILDPGHGGIDWGTFHTNASGKVDVREKDVVLSLAFQTAEILRAKGYTVVLTREKDELANFPAKDWNKDGEIDEFDDLISRIMIANEAKGELFLSLHNNSNALKNQVSGIESWYCLDRPFGKQSQAFAYLIQKETLASLKANGYNAPSRRVADDLGLTGDGKHISVLGPTNNVRSVATQMPGMLAETLFISNDEEARLLANPQILKAIAQGYARAIDSFFHPTS